MGSRPLAAMISYSDENDHSGEHSPNRIYFEPTYSFVHPSLPVMEACSRWWGVPSIGKGYVHLSTTPPTCFGMLTVICWQTNIFLEHWWKHLTVFVGCVSSFNLQAMTKKTAWDVFLVTGTLVFLAFLDSMSFVRSDSQDRDSYSLSLPMSSLEVVGATMNHQPSTGNYHQPWIASAWSFSWAIGCRSFTWRCSTVRWPRLAEESISDTSCGGWWWLGRIDWPTHRPSPIYVDLHKIVKRGGWPSLVVVFPNSWFDPPKLVPSAVAT